MVSPKGISFEYAYCLSVCLADKNSLQKDVTGGRRNGVAQSTQERDKCREAEKVAKEVELSVKIAQNCYLKTLSTANPDVRPKVPRDR